MKRRILLALLATLAFSGISYASNLRVYSDQEKQIYLNEEQGERIGQLMKEDPSVVKQRELREKIKERKETIEGRGINRSTVNSQGNRQFEDSDGDGLQDDYVISYEFPVLESLPVSASLSMEYYPPVGNQQFNNSSAWAMGYYGMGYEYRKNRSIVNPERLYSETMAPNFLYNFQSLGWDSGSNQTASYIQAKTTGIVLQTEFPRYSYEVYPSLNQQIRAFLNRGNHLNPLYGRVDSIKNALAQGVPVTASISVCDDFVKLYHCPSNFVYDSTYGNIRGDQVVAITGYQDDAELPGGGALRMRNSWGSDWGNNGDMWISYNFFDSYFSGPSYAMDCVSEDYKPTSYITIKNTPQINYSNGYSSLMLYVFVDGEMIWNNSLTNTCITRNIDESYISAIDLTPYIKTGEETITLKSTIEYDDFNNIYDEGFPISTDYEIVSAEVVIGEKKFPFSEIVGRKFETGPLRDIPGFPFVESKSYIEELVPKDMDPTVDPTVPVTIPEAIIITPDIVGPGVTPFSVSPTALTLDIYGFPEGNGMISAVNILDDAEVIWSIDPEFEDLASLSQTKGFYTRVEPHRVGVFDVTASVAGDESTSAKCTVTVIANWPDPDKPDPPAPVDPVTPTPTPVTPVVSPDVPVTPVVSSDVPVEFQVTEEIAKRDYVFSRGRVDLDWTGWAPAKTASKFNVFIETLKEMSGQFSGKSKAKGSSFTTTDTHANLEDILKEEALADGKYQWKVDSYEGDNVTGTLSGSFHVSTPDPKSPVAKPEEKIAVNNAKLLWEKSETEGITYCVTVNKSEYFTEDNFLYLKDLANGTYNWSVKESESGTVVKATETFTVDVAVTPVTPANSGGGGCNVGKVGTASLMLLIPLMGIYLKK